MLSDKEKNEMLEDAKSKSRREDFRFAGRRNNNTISFDKYLHFLNRAQKFFGSFKVSKKATLTKLNKL